jgi:hypothetical protein
VHAKSAPLWLVLVVESFSIHDVIDPRPIYGVDMDGLCLAPSARNSVIVHMASMLGIELLENITTLLLESRQDNVD